MNTKNKIVAILMAGIVAMAMIAPAAIGQPPATEATVNNVDPTYATVVTVTVAPGAESDGTVNFSLTVTDDNGADTINNTGWTANWSTRSDVPLTRVASLDTLTTKTFNGSDTIPYTTAPDTYTVTFKDDGVQVATDSFSVGGYSGFEIDFVLVSFGALNISEKETVVGDTNMSSGGPTIKNTGNTAKNVTINATDMTGVDTITKGNLDAKVGITEEQNLAAQRTFSANIPSGGTDSINFSLTAPPGSKQGDYSGNVTIGVV